MTTYYCNRVDIMSAHYLQECPVSIPLRQCFIEHYMPWHALPVIGLVQVEETESREKGITFFDIKLKSKLSGLTTQIPVDSVLRITTVSGEQFVIGTADKPFPVITQQRNYAASASNDAGCFLTAQLKSRYPLLAIV